MATFNDTFLVLIRDPDCPNPQWENIVVFRGLNPSSGQVEEKTLSLQALQECELLKNNLVAPVPTALLASRHADFDQDGQPDLNEEHYDHEFGGFSVPLTFESMSPLSTSRLYRKVLAPGVYNIKLVIQDVSDDNLDSAAMIKEHSFKVFSFLPADFDLDGDIDGRDYFVWSRNYGTTPATFTQGDANGDCVVNSADLTIWGDNYGQSGGNANYCSDFDRSGGVDGRDFFVWQRNVGMDHCASRFQGDADGDGDVDSCDLEIWQAEYGSGPLAVCACEGSGEAAMMAGGEAESEFDPADFDQDGKVDKADIDQLIDFWSSVEK